MTRCQRRLGEWRALSIPKIILNEPGKQMNSAIKDWLYSLEDMVRDESGHSEETERILRDWPLR